MNLRALIHTKAMVGHSQSQLILCSDKLLYVVKFQNNPQHNRVLANEHIATNLARALTYRVPPNVVVEVDEWFIASNPHMVMDLGRKPVAYTPGLQFGSQHVGGLMPGRSEYYLRDEDLRRVKNLDEISGVLVFDKWTNNLDGRQAIFTRRQTKGAYTATLIDHGHCFGAETWNLRAGPLDGVHRSNIVYSNVIGWSSFEPWLSMVEALSIDTIWEAARDTPGEWYGGSTDALSSLVEGLFKRRKTVADLISEFRGSYRSPFPNWAVSNFGSK